MANSLMVIISDGSLSTIPLTIQFFEQAHINVSVNDIPLPSGGYTYAWTGASTIQITPAVASGAKVIIQRKTPAAAILHDFQAGAVFSEVSVDENFRQELFLLQEANEQGLVTDLFADLNMHGFRITGLGSGANPGDAVNLQQAESLASSGGTSVLRAELLSDNGPSLIATKSALSGAVRRALTEVLAEYIPVTQFYQAADGGDYAKAVNRAFAVCKYVEFPTRPDGTPWAVNTAMHIPSKSCLKLNHCDLKCDVYINLFDMNGSIEPALIGEGVCRIIGNRIGTGGEPAATGLTIIDAYKPVFGATGCLIFQDWSDRGWRASSTVFTGNPSFGRVFNVDTRNNGVGWDLGDGNGCEYWTLTNMRSFSNAHGAYLKSPNTMIVGGGCTHNSVNGMVIEVGFNDGHSTISNFNMNHNNTNNLYIRGLANGFTFTGCQIFDDGEGTGTGKITIENSRGINFNGGQINADFAILGTCLANTFTGVFFTNQTRTYSILGDRSGLFFMNCSNPRGSGAFPFNDNTFSYTVGYVGAGQTGQIPLGTLTPIKVTPVTSKTVGIQSYDNPTGRWVARAPGRHALSVYADLGGSGAGAGNYILIKINGFDFMYIPCFTLSPGDVFGNAVIELENLNIGDYVEVLAFITVGTIAPRTRTRISMRLI